MGILKVNTKIHFAYLADWPVIKVLKTNLCLLFFMLQSKNTMNNFHYSQAELAKICQEAKVEYLALFGSQARQDASNSSDVDLLAEYEDDKSLFELARLKINFEKLFGKKVDLVEKKMIKPQIKPYIMQDVIVLYEKK